MYIRRYTLSSILLLVLTSWAVFAFVTQGNTGDIDIFEGYYLPDMPIAFAVLIPAVVLFIATISHMLFYSIIEYVRNRTRDSDFNKIEEAISMNLKGKIGDKPHYTSSLYRDMGELLNLSKIELNSSSELSNGNKFKELVKTLTAIKHGAVLELDSTVGYHIKELNYWNALKEDSHNAESVLMERGYYSDELYIEAFNHLCKVNTLSTIQRYDKWFNIEALFNMLARVDAEEEGLTLNRREILELMEPLSFSKENYTKLAKVFKDSNMSPDFRLELFKHFIDKSDDAVEGYLYTLLNLEMISEAEEVLLELQPENLIHIRAYVILKKSNPNLLDIDYFIR